jgi:putative ATPase
MSSKRRPSSRSHPPPGVQADLFTGRTPRLPSGTVKPGEGNAPLAARMRPTTLDDFFGQEDVVGVGTPLRELIENDELPSLILWGPPGSGKTTLAAIIARSTQRYFEPLSAVDSGVADIRRVVSEARARRRVSDLETVFFIDELHRFSRNQQDAVLPYVEDGTVRLLGATTENPSFYVVAPLLSRARVFTLKLLGPDALHKILNAALKRDVGLQERNVQADESALDSITQIAGGDARAALNLLELAAATASTKSDGNYVITRDAVDAAGQHSTVLYDREGDSHYDHISAYIKSVRSSDVDGALYWLVRMLEAGEDPLFVARRLVVLAAEDIGLADPHALTLAISAQQAVHFLGMPEGRLPLSEVTIYLARAPKSNSAYTAYQRAAADVKRTRNEPVPLHLRNASTGLMRELGYGNGYQYAHDYETHIPPSQTHRPSSVEGNIYYVAGDLGTESSQRGELL